MEKPTKVRILDHEYMIKGDEDEEQIQNIARFINDKFREIQDNAGGLSERKMAILVAFDIAGEYFRLLKKRENVAMDIQTRAQELNHQIDSVLG